MAVQVSLWPHLRFKRGRTHLQTHVIVGRIQISVSGDPSASVSFWVLARDCSQLLEATVSLCYMCVCACKISSHIHLYMTPWTVAHQAPLSMGFSCFRTYLKCQLFCSLTLLGWSIALLQPQAPGSIFITLNHSPHGSLLLLLLSRFSRVRLCATPETAAHQAPPSLGILQARTLEWVAISFSSA